MSAAGARRMLESGNILIVDPRRGISLLIEPTNAPLAWLVVSNFRRLDNGRPSEPFVVEYGKN